jgi:hypothetical protein
MASDGRLESQEAVQTLDIATVNDAPQLANKVRRF